MPSKSQMCINFREVVPQSCVKECKNDDYLLVELRSYCINHFLWLTTLLHGVRVESLCGQDWGTLMESYTYSYMRQNRTICWQKKSLVLEREVVLLQDIKRNVIK